MLISKGVKKAIGHALIVSLLIKGLHSWWHNMEETTKEKKCKGCVYYKEDGIYQGECRYAILYGTSSSEGAHRVEFNSTCEYWEEDNAEKKKKIDQSVKKYYEWKNKQSQSTANTQTTTQKGTILR